MDTPSFRENDISQIPALLLLQKLGYTYLTQSEAVQLRGGKKGQVLLDGVMRDKLPQINSVRSSSQKVSQFSRQNIETAIQKLKEIPMNEGYMAASEKAYEYLTMGVALQQNIDGDLKSFTLQYIDWKNIDNNVFHVAEEFEVTKAASKESQIPDIVLFVNGIPLVVIECKRPDIKNPIEEAIGQQLRNQREDGIRRLFIYSQLLMAIAVSQAKYATAGTIEKHWGIWREYLKDKATANEFTEKLQSLINSSLEESVIKKFLQCHNQAEQVFILEQESAERSCTLQDEYLYNMCRPQRLLELTKDYILFDEGRKKIARYQQYFVIKKIMHRVQTMHASPTGVVRTGGVVWHTQGSGKSLTMAMLAKQIALQVRNPKIILVTDRTDLDSQITGTLRDVDIPVVNAGTGNRLVELLKGQSDAVITTIINKFEKAVEQIKEPMLSNNIFVLIDEAHRTQYGKIGVKMRRVLPNACYVAFTGTPILKREKNTAVKFGGVIDPPYTVVQAVEDGAVLPIKYEGRHAIQDVNQETLDRYFDFLCEGLTPQQRADLKKKFSRAEQLNKTEQRVFAIVCDIVKDYTSNWGVDKTGERSGFKGMVVCEDRNTAVKFKKFFDQLDRVSTEVLFSPPDERENDEDTGEELDQTVINYYQKQKSQYGPNLEKIIINQFKKTEDPELLIVVDKLLTGFDEPKVVVMYLVRKLKEHRLLQAIARTNRVAEGKDYGLIIDYNGVLEELYKALEQYSGDLEFDPVDLEGALSNVAGEIARLPQLHSVLWDVFKAIKNKKDINAFALLLDDIALRTEFYQKLTAFARCLKLAYGSIEFEYNTPQSTKDRYANDLKFFVNLRNMVVNMYSEEVEFKQYEKQLQKLLDQHVTTSEVIRLTDQVNIFDKEAFEKEVEKLVGAAAQAHTIASRTSKYISEKLTEDPVFYKRLSELIQETIADYRAGRIKELEFLARMKEYSEQAMNKKNNDLPEVLKENEVAQAFYRLVTVDLVEKIKDLELLKILSTESAMAIDTIIKDAVLDKGLLVVDWKDKPSISGMLKIDIGDYLIDEVRDKYKIDLSFADMDAIAEKCIEVAKVRYK
jgi:type I restriction enzyme R subunit